METEILWHNDNDMEFCSTPPDITEQESGDFSSYQMERLLKRRSVQVCLEEAEKEMGGRSLSLGELEEMLTEQGVVAGMEVSKRIASDNVTRYLYLKEGAKQTTDGKITEKTTSIKEVSSDAPEMQQTASRPSTSVDSKSDFVQFLEQDESPPSSDSEQLTPTVNKLQMARDFIYENSGLTQEQILHLIKQQNTTKPLSRSLDMPSTSGDIEVISSTGAGSDVGKPANAEAKPSTNIDNVSSNVGKLDLKTFIGNAETKSSTSIDNVGSDVGKPDLKTLVGNAEAKPSTNIDNVSSNVGKLDRKTFIGNAETKSSTSIDNVGSDVGKPDLKTLVGNGERNTCTNIDNIDTLVEQNVVDSRQSQPDGKLSINSISSDKQQLPAEDDINAPPIMDPASTNSDVTESIQAESNSDESSSDSFVEVKDTVLQVVINPKEDCQDDIFADFFTDVTKPVSKNSDIEVTLTKAAEEVVSSPASNASLQVDQESTEKLQQLQDDLEEEQKQLLAEKGKQDRLATTISQQMQLEAQELLQLFGIPYIVAPMEAEAQCAFLDSVSLTEGTITDDSDIWLFGGRRVYKNFFNQKKYVLQFTIAQIQHCFKLSRHELVQLALLVGSDYTPGIQGVGPVTALEILAAFADKRDPLHILSRFQDWCKAGMPVGSGRTSLRSKLQGIQLSEGFPSMAVVNAYLQPEVDESKEAFSWGIPNLDSLREYTRRKFGWTSARTDEVIVPVINKISERQSQKSLDAYFKVVPKLYAAESKLSKRVQKAVEQMGGEPVAGEGEQRAPASAEKRKKKHINTKPTSKKARGKQSQKDAVPSTAQTSGIESNSEPATKKARGKQSQKNIAQTSGSESIPQRERDRLNALKNKLKAIEVFRTKHLEHPNKGKRKKQVILEDANLSESSSDE